MASDDLTCAMNGSAMRCRCNSSADATHVRTCDAMTVVNASYCPDARRVAITPPAVAHAIVRMSDSAPVAMVESPFETIVVAKRMASVMRMP